MRHSLWICVFTAALFASQASLGAQGNKAEAEKHFKSGLALFKAEKYDAAALELEASVKLFATKGGLFNLANIYKVLSRYDDALAAISRLDKEFGGKLDAEMKGAVAKMKAEIEGLIARLDLQVSPVGATVFVDGREMGRSPFSKPLSVDPGSHVVRAELARYQAMEAKVQVLSGQVERVTLKLEAVTLENPTVAAKPEEPTVEGEAEAEPQEGGTTAVQAGPEDSGRKKIGKAPFIIAGAVAVAAGAATIGLGVATGRKSDSAKDDGSQSEMDSAKKMQTAGRAMFGIALGAGVAAIVLAFFTDFSGEKEIAADAQASRGLEVDGPWPVAFEGGAGAAFGGRF
jgi:hypothetical protein